MRSAILLTGLALAVSGCSGTLSTARTKHPSVYPVSEEKADDIIRRTMQTYMSEHPLAKVEGRFKGYQTRILFGLDSEEITAYARSAYGKGHAPGYVFEVRCAGTMVFAGGVISGRLFNRIVAEAKKEVEPVPFVAYADKP